MQQPTIELDTAERNAIAPPNAVVAPLNLPPDTRSDVPLPHVEPNVFAEEHAKKPKRTLGLRVLDFWLYGIFNNASVFIASVLMTYLTNHGRIKGADGHVDMTAPLPHGKVGAWIFDRGTKFSNFCARWGMKSPKHIDELKMVAFSFADGTIAALGTKFIENKREPIAKWMDTQLGTLPPDDTPYEAEPKQSWPSFLSGRLLTFSLVYPTYLFLRGKDTDGRSWNDKLFKEPGVTLGNKIIERTGKETIFGHWKIADLAHVSIFEGFYTLLCTIGLYGFSRAVARVLGEHEEKKNHPAENATTQPIAHTIASDEPVAVPHEDPAVPDKTSPAARVANFSSEGRVQNAPALAQAT